MQAAKMRRLSKIVHAFFIYIYFRILSYVAVEKREVSFWLLRGHHQTFLRMSGPRPNASPAPCGLSAARTRYPVYVNERESRTRGFISKIAVRFPFAGQRASRPNGHTRRSLYTNIHRLNIHIHTFTH